jgi:hypothetical protein
MLDEIESAAFQFFWEQAGPSTGLVKDRAATSGDDTGLLSSIASTGFGLTASCIADSRSYQPRVSLKRRVITVLEFLLTHVETKNGFSTTT